MTTPEASTSPAWEDGPSWNDIAFEYRGGRPSGFVAGRVIVPKRTAGSRAAFPLDPDVLDELKLTLRGDASGGATLTFVVAEATQDARSREDWTRDKAAWTRERVARLRELGYYAQLDRVFFADQADEAGFAANPFAANPFAANPFAANPFAPNRWPRTTEAAAHGPARSTARPSPRGWRPFEIAPEGPTTDSDEGADASIGDQNISAGHARVLVLDTGLPEQNSLASRSASWLEGLQSIAPTAVQLVDVPVASSISSGDMQGYWRTDVFDNNEDGRLDPASGHGVFIASIIQRIAPSAATAIVRVVRRLGLAVESEVAGVLEWAAGLNIAERFDIVSMSFSAYDVPQDDYNLIGDAVHKVRQTGAVVVASAGNEGVWEAPLPASLHGVIAVAALDAHESGPAPFTNFGPWVDACAPGTDIEGEFWHRSEGERAWRGRALWSGTSFAAPYVAGAIARTMVSYGIGAQQAAGRLLDDRSRGSIPWHGRVIRGF